MRPQRAASVEGRAGSSRRTRGRPAARRGNRSRGRRPSRRGAAMPERGRGEQAEDGARRLASMRASHFWSASIAVLGPVPTPWGPGHATGLPEISGLAFRLPAVASVEGSACPRRGVRAPAGCDRAGRGRPRGRAQPSRPGGRRQLPRPCVDPRPERQRELSGAEEPGSLFRVWVQPLGRHRLLSFRGWFRSTSRASAAAASGTLEFQPARKSCSKSGLHPASPPFPLPASLSPTASSPSETRS